MGWQVVCSRASRAIDNRVDYTAAVIVEELEID